MAAQSQAAVHVDPVHKPSRYLVDDVAEYAIGQKSFPPEVIHEGKRMIMDQLACQIAAAPLPWSQAYLRVAKTFAVGADATAVYVGDRLPLDEAVFLNGAFGQGAEFDDVHAHASTHTGAVIVPIVLALAEKNRLSGKTALEAAIVGFEVLIRLAVAAAPSLHLRGHHVPAAVGPFGAAAAASRALGLSRETCVQALAIAGSHAGGLLEFTHGGGTVKRCHCGIAAVGGLRSTVMATNGITGPRSVFDGGRGFFKTFAGDYNLSAVTDGLGTRYELFGTGYKPMTSAFAAHAPLEALGDLQKEYNFGPDDIESINIAFSRYAYEHVGVLREPRDITDAHYSVAYGCAVRLYRGGNGFFDYREEDLSDPRFLAIVKRVQIEIDPVADEERLRLSARTATVTVTTKDGKQFKKRIQFSKGHPKNPLTDDDLMAKFTATVAPRLGEVRTKELADAVWGIESLADAGELVRLTVKDR